jgi:D-alanyl-D-alanine carboxypeptidase/D-alanyl-D-alanine-endopeptidase (penicillin-binding protein 4)
MSITRAVMRAPDFAFGVFKSYWQQSGGVLDGGLRLGPVPPGARLVLAYDSLALAEVIRLVNKYSSNVMARTLLLTLGAEKAGRPGSVAGGDRVIRDFLASRGIVVPDLVLENGSGLSRNERISAQGLADVLLDAWRSPYAAEFQASLPLSAVDGTLRRRFRSPDMEGRLRMKTGTLQDVSALAGYVNAASGKTYVTVVILNHPGAEHGAGEQVQAALIDWIFGR